MIKKTSSEKAILKDSMALSEEVLFFAAYTAVNLIFPFPSDGVPFAAAYAAISVFACFLPFTGGTFVAVYAAISVFACFLFLQELRLRRFLIQSSSVISASEGRMKSGRKSYCTRSSI